MAKIRTSHSPSLSLRSSWFLFLGTGAILAAIWGISSTTEITSANLHSSPICGSGYSTYELKWGSDPGEVSWTTGALSQIYENAGGSATNFTISYTGATYRLGAMGPGQTPNTQTFFSGGDHNTLGNYVSSGFGSGESIVITIDISPAIPATVAFDLYHINGDAAGGDNLVMYAVPAAGGANIYPSITDNGSPSWRDKGNGEVDAETISTFGDNANVGVNFNSSTMIDQIVLEWRNCDICGTGPHGMGIGNIEFCSTLGPDNDKDTDGDVDDIDDDNDGIPDHEEICGISSASGSVDVTVEIKLDGYPEETSWTLKEGASTLASGGPYTSGDANSVVSYTHSGTYGNEYTFEILDSYGDGLCCSGGYYQISVGGNVLVGPVSWSTGSSASEIFSAEQGRFYCLGGFDPNADDDNDGIINYRDSDFCTLNAAGVCQDFDADGDGIPNHLDLDADNDGIPDIVEAGGADSDGDGMVDDNTDTDGDGLADDFESGAGSTSILFDRDGDGINERTGDFDGDGLANSQDLDSDGDGITDVLEAGGTDSDANGLIDGYATDSDTDGLADAVDGDVGNDGVPESSTNALVRTYADTDNDGLPNSGYPYANQDGTGMPNFLDIDADDDGLVDNSEAQATAGFAFPANSDSDGDGIDNAYDDNDASYGGSGILPVNTDRQDEPDYLDTNSDNDNEADAIEGHDGDGDGNADASSPAKDGLYAGTDVDEDGLDDGFDNNTSSTDATNTFVNPSKHPLIDGGADRDWRDVSPTFPVEWLDFTAVWEDDHGLLEWQTATEENADHFQIERKVASAIEFETIGSVQAAGNSRRVQSYRYQDFTAASLAPNQRIHYRLKQVDFNGEFSYSELVELGPAASLTKLTVFPNPATDVLNVDIQSSGQGSQLIRIIDMNGRVLHEQIASGTHRMRVPVDAWARGIYTVQLVDEVSEVVKTKKVVLR